MFFFFSVFFCFFFFFLCSCVLVSSTMHIASETQVRPFDLTPKILKNRSRMSDGGQIVQELNSIREGKHWDDAKGGWLDPVLVRKAREEGDAVRKEARGVC